MVCGALLFCVSFSSCFFRLLLLGVHAFAHVDNASSRVPGSRDPPRNNPSCPHRSLWTPPELEGLQNDEGTLSSSMESPVQRAQDGTSRGVVVGSRDLWSWGSSAAGVRSGVLAPAEPPTTMRATTANSIQKLTPSRREASIDCFGARVLRNTAIQIQPLAIFPRDPVSNDMRGQ